MHPYEKDFETVETASDIDVVSDSDCEQWAASSCQASADQLTGTRGVHWAKSCEDHRTRIAQWGLGTRLARSLL
jgi:hypothetical protein